MKRPTLRAVGAVMILCALTPMPGIVWGEVTLQPGAREVSSLSNVFGIGPAPCVPVVDSAAVSPLTAGLGGGSSSSVSAGSPLRREPETTTAKKNCLWRVQSKTSTLYILGSVHLLKKESYPLDAAMENAFGNVRKLVLEVDQDVLEKPSTMRMMMSKGMFGDRNTLKSSVSPDTYELVKKRTAELGMPIERLSKFKPWLLSITVAAGKLLQLGFDPGLGVDKHFFRKAKESGIPIVALETIEYQISRFDDMAPATQEAMLRQTLKDLEILEKEFNAIVESWSAGDTASLDALMRKSFEQFPEVYEKLIAERNRNWLPQIEALSGQDENCMVVVGALHLVGKDGIVEMLRQKGHTVDQL
ncbi:MAG: TraB/GumN family protein [Thermodesulfobacteriota bacterium]